MENLANVAPYHNGPLGLYIHIPFCERKCPYCDFNTYAGLESLFDDLVDALCLEMARWREPMHGRSISTVFVGGGTPTVLAADALTRLFDTLFTCFELDEGAEITCEANPGTVDRAKFEILKKLGVNRLSMGVQSFQTDELAFLGRIHSVDDVYRAWETATKAGFDNVNLDFIFGLPDQRPDAWQETIQHALAMSPAHLSLYSLIVENDTPLKHWVETGKVAMPDDDVAAAQYEVAMELLAAAGYLQYEVSNWARETAADSYREEMPALACRHNLIYWRNQHYLGIGPGAHSHLTLTDGQGTIVEKRWGNHRPVAGYVKRIRNNDSVEAFSEEIPPGLSMGETMMLGLRLLNEGIKETAFVQRYNMSLDEVYGETVARLTAQELVIKQDGRLILTPRGLMIGDQIFMEFLTSSSQ